MQFLAAALAIGLAAVAAAFSIAHLTGKTVEAMARQPEIAGQLRAAMIVAIAFVEALALYALVVSLLVIFTK